MDIISEQSLNDRCKEKKTFKWINKSTNRRTNESKDE